ncbi:hypothetical protein DL771_002624 [Monosporascus sp. 5C6A]|nr:hypothetical protein DL771_002624 [Monosporascus sp. 5C6A]
MVISKKTVLLTGCSNGGIGASMAEIIREKGYHVFSTLPNTFKARTLIGLNDVEILELGVTSKESIARCAEQGRKRTGGTLDMLINNAGRDFLMPLMDTDIEEAKEFFNVFAPMLIKAKGVIVNHSSIVRNLLIPWGGIYSSSKAAVKQLSEILRVELEPLGVRVVTALIGAVDTQIFANSHPDAFKMP